jgi:hypothetical protein
MMKHLLSGVALAALLTAGLPVMAQTSSDSTKQPPAAQSGTPATGASTSMPAGTDARQSGSTTAPSADMSKGPAKNSKPPAAADAQSGTAATGAKSSTAADTDSARSGASTSPQSGASTAGSMDKSSASAGSGSKHESSPSDNMAEQLNKQELQRVQNGGQPTSGSTQPPAGSSSGSH